MENALVSLASHVSPEALSSGKPDSLKTGSLNFAADIVQKFTDDSGNTPKLVLLQSMVHLTCDEFASQLKRAQKLASELDAQLSGFVPIEGTKKNSERYGPRRNVLNTQVSTARQVFGALKKFPEAFQGFTSFTAAVQEARKLLEDNNITWEGNTIPSDEQKKNKANVKAITSAEQELMSEHPQNEGESIMDYKLRLAGLIESKLEHNKQQAIIKGLVKELGSMENVLNVCLSILRDNCQPVQLDEAAQLLWDEASIIRMGDVVEMAA